MNRRVNRYSARAATPLPGFLYLLLTAVVGAWLAWDAFSLGLLTSVPWSDYWDHTAVLSEWVGNLWNPANPHVNDPSLSANFMPFFFVLALIGTTFGFDAHQLMAVAAVINFVLIVVGIKLFTQAYFRSPWAPLFGFVVLFMFWGAAWSWPNVLQLRNFFYVAAHPATFVFGLSLLTFWITLGYARGAVSVFLAGPVLVVLSSLMFLTNPLTAVFGVVGCVMLTLTEPGSRRLDAMVVFAMVLAGLGLSELWPFFSVWQLALGLYANGSEIWLLNASIDAPQARFESSAWNHVFYEPGQVLNSLGLSLLGLPVIAWLWLRRQHTFLVYGFLAMLVPYVLNLFVDLPFGHRFLLFAVPFMQLAIVWALLQIVEYCSALPRPAGARPLQYLTAAAMCAVVGINVWMLNLEFNGSTLATDNLEVSARASAGPDGKSTLDTYKQLLQPIAEESVVLTTPRVGWPVSTVKGKVVVPYRNNPLLSDQSERLIAIEDFFVGPVTDIRRVEIIQKYGTSHVVIDVNDTNVAENTAQWLASYAKPVNEVGAYRLYELPAALQSVELPKRTQSKATLATTRSPESAPAADASVNEPAPVREPATAEPQVADPAEEEPAASFGAPIAQPMLDPERHGA